MANSIGVNETAPNDDGVEVPALPTDQLGRPVLEPSQAYKEALEQGYYGNDGLDLGAAVSPEDHQSFDEGSARINQPAHSEPKVVEVTDVSQGGYTALGAPVAPPVVGDATQADAPSVNTSTPVVATTAGDVGLTDPASTEPVEASSTGTVESTGDTTTEQENV